MCGPLFSGEYPIFWKKMLADSSVRQLKANSSDATSSLPCRAGWPKPAKCKIKNPTNDRETSDLKFGLFLAETRVRKIGLLFRLKPVKVAYQLFYGHVQVECFNLCGASNTCSYFRSRRKEVRQHLRSLPLPWRTKLSANTLLTPCFGLLWTFFRLISSAIFFQAMNSTIIAIGCWVKYYRNYLRKQSTILYT